MTTTAIAPVVSPVRPPKDQLFRGFRKGLELREAGTALATMVGHFAVFNRWTEIESMWEGNFMERLAPGSFRKAFQEPARSQIRSIFEHGYDFQLSNQILGSIDVLREDDTGAYYEVPLFRGIPELIMEGLRADAYGASFRFRVTREDFNKAPEVSDYNPKGIPERTIREVELYEFGPVTFPAYAEATAGLRSLTDEFMLRRFVRDPERLKEVLRFAPIAPSRLDAARNGHLEKERSVVAKEELRNQLERATGDVELDEQLQAVDAAIDEAIVELEGGNPDQGLALLYAAGNVVDQALQQQGLPDADENEEGSTDVVAASKDRRPSSTSQQSNPRFTNTEEYLEWIARI